MVLSMPFGSALNSSAPSVEDQAYKESASDTRLPVTTDAVPAARVDALRVMHLTDPSGVAVTFLPGEALPGWALPQR